MQQFMQEYSLQEICSALYFIHVFPVLLFSIIFCICQLFNTHLAKSSYQPVNLAKFLLPSDDSKQQ